MMKLSYIDGRLWLETDTSRREVSREEAEQLVGCPIVLERHYLTDVNGAISRSSPDGSVTVTVPCDEAKGEL